MNPLIETWQIHNRINLYLLENIDEANLNDQSASKGRTVGQQFAHIHNVRMMWLKAASPALLDGLLKIEKEGVRKEILKDALTSSGIAIEQLFEQVMIKGFKPHATGFLGYLVSHESHHRGQIMLTLKQCGHMLPQSIQYGLWEWGTR